MQTIAEKLQREVWSNQVYQYRLLFDVTADVRSNRRQRTLEGVCPLSAQGRASWLFPSWASYVRVRSQGSRSKLHFVWLGMLAPMIALSGCATYQANPLTDQAVARALTMPAPAVLAGDAEHLDSPILRPIQMDPSKPLSPEEAAVLAVLVNPALRAQRDRIGTSSAQLIQAGLLPNPQINPIAGLVLSGAASTNPYGIGASFDFTSLITRNAKRRSAQLSLQSVRLDVAWAEWQTAEAAKSATYAVIALDHEAVEAEAADRWLAGNLTIIKGAYDRHQQTVLQLSAAQAASAFAHATLLSVRQGLAAERAKLRTALGLPLGTALQVRDDDELPCELPVSHEQDVLNGLSDRRLDLLGLRKGYLSQEQKVREAVLAQFPRINLGLSQATDNTNVTSINFAATISLPIFDRNQGAIAIQRATRQQLYDEYVSRDYRARTDVAQLFADIGTLIPQIAAERSAIPELDALATNLRRAMLLGNESLIVYYGQVQNVSTARIELIKLEGQLANDWVSLELASSMLLPKPMACPELAPTKGLQ